MATPTDSKQAMPDAAKESELLARLAALPAPALAPEANERIHRRARGAFVRASERARHPWLERLARAYTRFEPIMAGTVAAAQLTWAFHSVLALYQ